MKTTIMVKRFSSLDKPKRSKELKEKISKGDSHDLKADSSAFVALPAAYLSNFQLRGRTARLGKKMKDQVIDRLNDLSTKASGGDRMAQEFLNKASSNPDKFAEQVNEAIAKSPKIKRAKAASVAIPVAIGAGFILKSQYHKKKKNKLNEEIKKDEAKYKQELKEWKMEKNKREEPQKTFSLTMTEEELKLFSEFLEQKEFNSKAQKARRKLADISKAEARWEEMGLKNFPKDSQYHKNAQKFGRTIWKNPKESGVNSLINDRSKGIQHSNYTRKQQVEISRNNRILKKQPNVGETVNPILKGKVSKLRKISKSKTGKAIAIGTGLAGAAALGTVAYKKIKED